MPGELYLSVDDLKEALHDTRAGGDDDPLYERALTAASRLVDKWAGRYFHRDPEPSARPLRATTGYWCWTGDFPDATGMVVETDTDGAWTTWAVNEWLPEPVVRFHDEPFTRVVAIGARAFPVTSRALKVRVTAVWGWPAVPTPVVQATQILATLYYRAKDLTGAELGVEGDSERLSGDPIALAKSLVEPYAVPGGLLHKVRG